MLSKTNAHLFNRPTEGRGFLQRMIEARKILAAVPVKKGATCLVSVSNGALGGAGYKLLKKSLVVGRASCADWRVEDSEQKLSGLHFKVTLSGEEILLEDLDSTNGTRVNENTQRIEHGCVLRHGDFIHAGGCSFMLAIQDA